MLNIIGQQLIIGIRGTSLTDEERKFIVDNNIGGVILFQRNVESPEQIHELTTEIQSLRHEMRDKAPLFVSVDMEGGRVHRLQEPFTQWPPVRNLGDLDSSSLAFRYGLSMGEELRAFGMNMDFAPCADILLDPENEVIGDRAAGTDSKIVTQTASALVRGYIKAGVIPCVKHFPGHGSTKVDSHIDLPVSKKKLIDLDSSQELEPFKRAFKSRCELVMTAHMSFPNIDPEWPVTLSPIFLQQILRTVLRYRGMIITDDLDMKAVAKHFPRKVIPVQSLRAGANILLYCNNFESPGKALEDILEAVKNKELDPSIIERNHADIIAFKKKNLEKPHEPFPLDKAMEVIQRQEHKEFALAVASGEAKDFAHQVKD